MGKVMRMGRGDFILFILSAVLVGVLLNSAMNPGTEVAEAGLVGTNYLWADSVATTTSAQDSFFTVAWEQVVFKSDTIDVWYRVGSPDTNSWSSREWILLDSGESVSFGPATKLKRIEWKSAAGSGVVFFQGYKKSPQY